MIITMFRFKYLGNFIYYFPKLTVDIDKLIMTISNEKDEWFLFFQKSVCVIYKGLYTKLLI